MMDTMGRTVEVLGVPDLLPDERTIDKLLIYFLRTKHGGGEVLKALYPCYQPGQAFVTFEKPEVAARVLRRSPHILELNSQQHYLTVKAANYDQMDFPVEATLQLSAVADKAEVLEILRSYGFVLEGPTSDHVRVKGSFLKLKSVKASLEMLLKSPAQAGVTPSPSSRTEMSSGAISKHHTDPSDAKRGPLESQRQRASPSAPISCSLEDFPESPDQAGSVRTGRSCSSIVDSDVFDYANCLWKKDVNAILVSRNVGVRVRAVDDYYVITLSGKSAKVCMTKLKTLLDNLHQSLRTQEVPLKDLTPEGRRLAARIEESRNVYKSVLVQKRNSRLHLIGPSGGSYELQQTLLGRTVEQPQPRGRRPHRKATRRSRSLPPTNRETEGGAGAARSPPGRYQGPRQEAAEARRRLGGPAVT